MQIPCTKVLRFFTICSPYGALGRGLYDFPKMHPKLGALAPPPDVVAQALARETGSVVQIAGARAANALGLSTQVPAKNTYLTNGPPRRVVLGKRVIDLRHAVPKHLVAPGSPAGTVIQALCHLGPRWAPQIVDIALKQLSVGDKRLLGKTLGQAPAWMLAGTAFDCQRRIETN